MRRCAKPPPACCSSSRRGHGHRAAAVTSRSPRRPRPGQAPSEAAPPPRLCRPAPCPAAERVRLQQDLWWAPTTRIACRRALLGAAGGPRGGRPGGPPPSGHSRDAPTRGTTAMRSSCPRFCFSHEGGRQGESLGTPNPVTNLFSFRPRTFRAAVSSEGTRVLLRRTTTATTRRRRDGQRGWKAASAVSRHDPAAVSNRVGGAQL